MGDKRKQKVQRYKSRKAKEAASKTSKAFINPRDVKGARGDEHRQGQLGQEFMRRAKSGGLVDKREHGDDADELQMLGRMRKVRQTKADNFKLGDSSGDSLTHYGNALGAPVRREAAEDDNEPAAKRRKTRNEVLDEIIDKSRTFREEKKQVTEQRNSEVTEVDYEFGGLKGLDVLKYRKDEKKALPAGLSIAPIPGSDPKAAPAAKKGGVLVLGSDGAIKSSTVPKGKGKADPAMQAKMDKLLSEARTDDTPAEEPEEQDAYDSFLRGLENSTIAKAGSRSKSHSELAAEAQAQLITLQREKTRRMRGGKDEDSDDEQNEAKLYQPHYSAEDTQEVRDSKARKQASSLFENYMNELETECKPNDKGAVHVSFERVDTIVEQLHKLVGVSPLASCMTARGMLEVLNEMLEIEVRGQASKSAQAATPFSLIVPAAFSRLFPPTDFRHPVSTPLALYLASSLSQIKLVTLRDVAVGLFRAGVLVEMSTETHRYCGEVLTFLANVLSLQCTEAVHMDTTAGKRKRGTDTASRRRNQILPSGIATLSGAEGVGEAVGSVSLLSPEGAGKAKRLSAQPVGFDVFCSADHTIADTPSARHQLLIAAYKLANLSADVYNGADSTESFEAAFSPLITLLGKVDDASDAAFSAASEPLKTAHNALKEKLQSLCKANTEGRMPLQLQAHRPIPLPLYACKVTDFDEGEEDERRQLKKEFKQERRKVLEQIRQDSKYLHRAKEKENAYNDEKRESKLNEVMTELQGQRSLVKQSDVARQKLKDMQKKSAKK